jgi:hypothetical protein
MKVLEERLLFPTGQFEECSDEGLGKAWLVYLPAASAFLPGVGTVSPVSAGRPFVQLSRFVSFLKASNQLAAASCVWCR